uniref:Uncharacterized protein n=1 Tax=Timema douglasi TaxID=61478 RepID=A0A7R8VYY2_TIMDO|nr:unnamed protein product [Timema douglasi]
MRWWKTIHYRHRLHELCRHLVLCDPRQQDYRSDGSAVSCQDAERSVGDRSQQSPACRGL